MMPRQQVWLVGHDSGTDQSIITALDTLEAAKAVRDAWEHFFPPEGMFEYYFIQPVYVETLDEAMNIKGFDASRN